MNVVRVGVAPWPHLNPDCFPSRITGCKAGVELDLLDTLAVLANVTISLVVSNTLGCGNMPTTPNGSWIGLLKMIHDNEIDMIGNLCIFNKLAHVKQNYFGTSWPVWQYQGQFVIRTPRSRPLFFSPFAPYRKSVWIAYAVSCTAFLIFLILHSFTRYGFSLWRFFRAATTLGNLFCGFLKNLPFEHVWPWWLLLQTTVFILYNTFILSALLHPFPIWRPFSDSNDYAAEVLSGRYRILSYKNPPPMPEGCVGMPCEKIIKQGISRHNFEYIPNGTGFQMLSAIADQDPDSKTQLVLRQGMPFMSLYFSEYRSDKNRLWLIDEKDNYAIWSGYMWRKNFSFAESFNNHIRNIGDYKLQSLLKYVRSDGARPQMGDSISEQSRTQKINLIRIRTLFYVHFGGVVVATLLLLIEIAFSKVTCPANRLMFS